MHKITDHLLGRLKVGNHAVAHGALGHHIAGRSPQHFFGVTSDGQHLIRKGVHRHNGRLV